MRNRLSLTAGLLLFVGSMAGHAIGDDAPPLKSRSSREHTALVDSSQRTLYVVTEISDTTETRYVNVILVEDVLAGERFVMRLDFDVTKPVSVTEFSDVTGKTYIRHLLESPTTAKTLAEMRRQSQINPALSEAGNDPVTIETPSFTHAFRESDLGRRDVTPLWLSQLRQTLPPSMLDALERMRANGFFASTYGMTYYHAFLEHLFYSECGSRMNLTPQREQPDCHFDKSFGYACSEKQLARIAKAQKDNRPLTFY